MYVHYLNITIFNIILCFHMETGQLQLADPQRGYVIPHRDGGGLEQNNARLYGGAAVLHARRQLLGDGLRQLHGLARILLHLLCYYHVHRVEFTRRLVCNYLLVYHFTNYLLVYHFTNDYRVYILIAFHLL